MEHDKLNNKVQFRFHDFYRKKDGTYIIVGKIIGSARGVLKIPAAKIVSERRDLLEKFSNEDVINIIGLAVTENPPTIVQKKVKHFKYFYILAMFFGCSLLVSNIASSKLMDVYGITLTGGMLPYLITYILGDIITEVYGYKRTRQLIWGAMACNLFATFFIWLSVIAPSAASWPHQNEYSLVLAAVPRIIFASMVSYFSSEFLNSYLIAKLKIFYGGEKLWLRIILSTLIAMTVDNFLFLFLAYQNVMPLTEMMQFSSRSYMLSLLFEWAFIPVIAYIARKLKNIEHIDVFDIHTNFTPFSLDVDYENK